MSVASNKKESKRIREKIMFRPHLVWDRLNSRERKEAFAFAEDYKKFLDIAKTEREAVIAIENHARKNGFRKAGGTGGYKKIYRSPE